MNFFLISFFGITPVETGIEEIQKRLDTGIRRYDTKGSEDSFNELGTPH